MVNSFFAVGFCYRAFHIFQQKGVNTEKAGNKSLVADSQALFDNKVMRIKRCNSLLNPENPVNTKNSQIDLYQEM